MKDHYDVGILGVWYGCNYGSIATYYALQQTIEKLGYSMVLEEETLQDQLLLDTVNQLYDNRQAFIDAMSKGGSTDSIEKILQQSQYLHLSFLFVYIILL